MGKVKKSGLRATALAIVATLAGFCNSLLGAGGGILLSLTMGGLLDTKEGESLDRRDILTTSQAAMIPGCALSCLIYAQNGSLDTTSFSLFAIPAVIGGAVGAILLSRINSRWITRIFSALVIWSGMRMLVG